MRKKSLVGVGVGIALIAATAIAVPASAGNKSDSLGCGGPQFPLIRYSVSQGPYSSFYFTNLDNPSQVQEKTVSGTGAHQVYAPYQHASWTLSYSGTLSGYSAVCN